MSGYTLKRPCPHCPFRVDIPGYLRRGRAIEIAESIACGSEFPCHKTTVLTDDGEDLEAGPDSQFCAGALIVLERQQAPNQAMRIAERVGVYAAVTLDMEAPVARSLFEFVDHHSEEGDDVCCVYSGPGCEAPAGMLYGNIALPSDNTLADLLECPGCGEMVCGSCATENGHCPDCEDSDADD